MPASLIKQLEQISDTSTYLCDAPFAAVVVESADEISLATSGTLLNADQANEILLFAQDEMERRCANAFETSDTRKLAGLVQLDTPLRYLLATTVRDLFGRAIGVMCIVDTKDQRSEDIQGTLIDLSDTVAMLADANKSVVQELEREERPTVNHRPSQRLIEADVFQHQLHIVHYDGDEQDSTDERSAFNVSGSAEDRSVLVTANGFSYVGDLYGRETFEKFMFNLEESLRNVLASLSFRDASVTRKSRLNFLISVSPEDTSSLERISFEICNRLNMLRYEHDAEIFTPDLMVALPRTAPTAVSEAAESVLQKWQDSSFHNAYVSDDATESNLVMSQLGDETPTKPGLRKRRQAHTLSGERVAEFMPPLNSWNLRFHNAMLEDRFVLFAQMVEPLRQDNFNKEAIEVLLRLETGDGKILGPENFMPEARRLGMLVKLDRWVVGEVLAHLSPDSMENATVSINVSDESIADVDFIDWVAEQTEASPHYPSRIVFEIRESQLLKNQAATVEFVHQARQAGFGVGLDNVGRIKTESAEPVDCFFDYIKLDGAFMKGLPTVSELKRLLNRYPEVSDEDTRPVTIASAVESLEVFSHVVNLNLDFAQGFLIHEPEAWNGDMVI